VELSGCQRRLLFLEACHGVLMFHVLQHGWYPYKFTLSGIKLSFTWCFYFSILEYCIICFFDMMFTHSNWNELSPQGFPSRSSIQIWISSVLVLVDEVLYSHGSTLHPYLLAYQLSTAEDSTHQRNQLQGVFFLGDQGYSLTCRCPAVLWSCPISCLLNVNHIYR
jgi:hypothetical protein